MPNNRAIFIDSFKNLPGKTYLISGDAASLVWLSQKLGQILSGTANRGISIGDSQPFKAEGHETIILLKADIDRPAFKKVKEAEYNVELDRVSCNELMGKVDGMIALDKPCHNYLDMDSPLVRRICISTGEYSGPMLLRMEQDSDLP